jgi:hypothetical protein
VQVKREKVRKGERNYEIRKVGNELGYPDGKGDYQNAEYFNDGEI